MTKISSTKTTTSSTNTSTTTFSTTSTTFFSTGTFTFTSFAFFSTSGHTFTSTFLTSSSLTFEMTDPIYLLFFRTSGFTSTSTSPGTPLTAPPEEYFFVWAPSQREVLHAMSMNYTPFGARTGTTSGFGSAMTKLIFKLWMPVFSMGLPSHNTLLSTVAVRWGTWLLHPYLYGLVLITVLGGYFWLVV